jgi:formamidopyrimidine-DNA glycosylase
VPELPEVEVLVRHLAPQLRDRTIERVGILRRRSLVSISPARFKRALCGSRIIDLTRRGKYLVFTLGRPGDGRTFPLLGHLGMTGRMYLQAPSVPLPRHAVAEFLLGATRFVFEDTRCFGRLTLDIAALAALGPEPLSDDFTTAYFARELKRSAQPIKVKLLDQSLVAGVGNIYACESLFRARLSPCLAARRLTGRQTEALLRSVRGTLADAIEFGSGLLLDWAGAGPGVRDGLFYYGRAEGASGEGAERLLVYDRAGRPCHVCATPIRRMVQAGRSTFYCPRCQSTRGEAAGKTSVDGAGVDL